MTSTHPSKDINWQTYKKEDPTICFYKKPTLQTEKTTDLG
jgi:hypothetical protein